MAKPEQSSTLRIVTILLRLLRGEALSYDQLQADYGKSLRTLQRDLTEIRSALMDTMPEKMLPRTPDDAGNFSLQSGDREENLAGALAIGNIVLASRSLVPAEKDRLLAFLMTALDGEERLKLHDYLRYPAGSYVPTYSTRPLLDDLRDMAEYICAEKKLTFSYEQSSTRSVVMHHGQPLAMYFDNMYFYVMMQSDEHHGLWAYRLDRILAITAVRRGAHLKGSADFSLQDTRAKSYLLAVGEQRTIEFRYWYFPKTALDRFPLAQVVKTYPDGSIVIRADVRYEGVKMWLLSQGPGLQLLSPPDLVADLKATLLDAAARYED